jgi:hypothetical protein
MDVKTLGDLQKDNIFVSVQFFANPRVIPYNNPGLSKVRHGSTLESETSATIEKVKVVIDAGEERKVWNADKPKVPLILYLYFNDEYHYLPYPNFISKRFEGFNKNMLITKSKLDEKLSGKKHSEMKKFFYDTGMTMNMIHRVTRSVSTPQVGMPGMRGTSKGGDTERKLIFIITYKATVYHYINEEAKRDTEKYNAIGDVEADDETYFVWYCNSPEIGIPVRIGPIISTPVPGPLRNTRSKPKPAIKTWLTRNNKRSCRLEPFPEVTEMVGCRLMPFPSAIGEAARRRFDDRGSGGPGSGGPASGGPASGRPSRGGPGTAAPGTAAPGSAGPNTAEEIKTAKSSMQAKTPAAYTWWQSVFGAKTKASENVAAATSAAATANAEREAEQQDGSERMEALKNTPAILPKGPQSIRQISTPQRFVNRTIRMTPAAQPTTNTPELPTTQRANIPMPSEEQITKCIADYRLKHPYSTVSDEQIKNDVCMGLWRDRQRQLKQVREANTTKRNLVARAARRRAGILSPIPEQDGFATPTGANISMTPAVAPGTAVSQLQTTRKLMTAVESEAQITKCISHYRLKHPDSVLSDDQIRAVCLGLQRDRQEQLKQQNTTRENPTAKAGEAALKRSQATKNQAYLSRLRNPDVERANLTLPKFERNPSKTIRAPFTPAPTVLSPLPRPQETVG